VSCCAERTRCHGLAAIGVVESILYQHHQHRRHHGQLCRSCSSRRHVVRVWQRCSRRHIADIRVHRQLRRLRRVESTSPGRRQHRRCVELRRLPSSVILQCLRVTDEAWRNAPSVCRDGPRWNASRRPGAHGTGSHSRSDRSAVHSRVRS